MSGCEGRYFCRVIIFLYLFHSSLSLYKPHFKDFPSHVLLHHISVSRHLPVCVLLRNRDEGSKLENVLFRLWRERNLFHNATSWEIGSFSVEKEQSEVISIPSSLPSVRCYLGETVSYDYEENPTRAQLTTWFKSLFLQHEEHLLDVTEEVIDATVRSHIFTIIAFPNLHVHKKLTDVVHQISFESDDEMKSLIVHPHSEKLRVIQQKLSISCVPCAVIVQNTGNGKHLISKVFPEVRLQKKTMETYIQARRIKTDYFSMESFDLLVRNTSIADYVPYIVGFYAFWVPNVKTFLRFFELNVYEFADLGIQLRFGLVDLSEENKLVSRYIDSRLAASFPFTILFTRDPEDGKLTQKLIKSTYQSPVSLYAALKEMGVAMTTKTGEFVLYQPYGVDDQSQRSLTFEGPLGIMCSTVFHNLTDNNPKRRKPKKQAKKLKKKKVDWHNRHVFDEIESNLPKEDGLPVVSHDSWSQVVEKSHAPRHPFSPDGRWAGEYTNVAMVVFLIDGCGSCRRNWGVFKQLYQTVKYVDGGSLYIANCTSDPQLCLQHGVTGFPTIVSFRGFGWLGNSECVSPDQEGDMIRPIRLDYHGVILVKPIMEWFSSVSSQAVTNLKFGQMPSMLSVQEDVRLVSVLMPKSSRYLPKSLHDSPERVYTYQCFRLVCERLYAQAKCYTLYNSKIPHTEFQEDDNLDVVVMKVSLERRDGVKVDIVQLGRYLRQTISEERGSHLRSFHKPHRYNLLSSQKCEDDHAACTDLILSFMRDHARLPVTHMTATSFHTKNSPLFEEKLPVLLSLVHRDNITKDTEFLQMLTKVGGELYKDMAVVTVDVDLYPDWVSKFVPFGYAKKASVESEVPELYHYPRVCIIFPWDHHRAAFYPPVASLENYPTQFTYTFDILLDFARHFLQDPESHLIPTEHF